MIQRIKEIFGLVDSSSTVKGSFEVMQGLDIKGMHRLFSISSNILDTNYVSLLIANNEDFEDHYDVYFEVKRWRKSPHIERIGVIVPGEYALFSIYNNHNGADLCRITVNLTTVYIDYPVKLRTGWLEKSGNPFIKTVINFIP